jgi:hypothetical protein
MKPWYRQQTDVLTARGPKDQPEFRLQSMIAEFLRTKHRRVMFLSDVRASLKLTIPQQVRAKKIQAEDFAMPDMVLFAPRANYAGMFLEIKADTPYRKDGCLKTDPHLARQMDAIEALRAVGYHADFYWDFDQATAMIDWYLRLEPYTGE